MSSSSVPRYLSQAKYRYQDQSRRDVDNALEQYGCLYPDLEKYIFPNGQERELLALKGTVPVSYKRNTYNIPICIYLTDNHPYSPPLCYVRPTPEMSIKESKHVDSAGFIYLPYLSDWKSDTSDLLGVIQVMIIIFSETPPVYQKPKGQPAYKQPPYPTTQGFPMPSPMNIPMGSTPYPPVSTNQQPYAGAGGGGGGASNQYPFSHNYQPPTGAGQPSYPNPGQSPYPSQNNPYGGQQQQQQPYTGGGQGGYPPAGKPPSEQSPVGTGTITEEHIRASLVSAVEDRAKEKVRERLGKCHAEVDVLRRTGEELTRGREKLDEMMKKMEKELGELENSRRLMKTGDEQLGALVAKYEGQEESKVDVDEAFGPSQTLYKQLLNLFAQENAVVDAIYYLGEALRKNVIDLEVFLKHIRELSREQFTLRALMQKCRDKAGLPC